MMSHKRTYKALFLLLLFCCYYSGISMFSHVHLVNGSSIVHSHLGGGNEHSHSDSQYAVIDMLSHFQSECAVDLFFDGIPFFQLSETVYSYDSPLLLQNVSLALSLRGPPQA